MCSAQPEGRGTVGTAGNTSGNATSGNATAGNATAGAACTTAGIAAAVATVDAFTAGANIDGEVGSFH